MMFRNTLIIASILLAFSHTAFAKVINVKDGQSIQAAVKKAQPGDTIKVHPGTYKETVYIDKNDITLSGVVVKGEWPTMDGEKKLNDAVLYSGHGITVEHLKIINYKGIMYLILFYKCLEMIVCLIIGEFDIVLI